METMLNESPVPQTVDSPITRSAIFLVATLTPGEEPGATVRALCGDVAALVRSVGKRVPAGDLSCVVGFGAAAWDALFGAPRPASLHAFREIGTGERVAVSTPGDLLLHIRAEQMDLCFELATQLVARLGDAVTVVDEVHGFRYFDMRSMIGFVDGTENPEGREVPALHPDRRRGRGLRRRQLRTGAEVPARHGRLERAAHRNAGAHHRPHQAVRHRAGRRR